MKKKRGRTSKRKKARVETPEEEPIISTVESDLLDELTPAEDIPEVTPSVEESVSAVPSVPALCECGQPVVEGSHQCWSCSHRP